MQQDHLWYVANPNGHVWQLDEDGLVDIYALDFEFHNGPMCKVCWLSFCEHCQREGDLEPCPGESK
jgi:hypothetical protein